MNQQFKNDLLKLACQKHPVLAILGDPEFNLDRILPELEKISTEVQIFEFVNKESFRKLDEFLLLFAKNLKIAICIFNNLNQNLISGILKKIEDVAERTCFVLLAPYLPETILNRAFLINHPLPREEIDWVEGILEQWDGASELIFTEIDTSFQEIAKKEEKNANDHPQRGKMTNEESYHPPQNGKMTIQESHKTQEIPIPNINKNQEKIFKAILVWFEKKLLRMSRNIPKLREDDPHFHPSVHPAKQKVQTDKPTSCSFCNDNSTHLLHEQLKSEFSLGYALWKRLVEIEFWFDSKEITASSGIEMALSILTVSNLFKKN